MADAVAGEKRHDGTAGAGSGVDSVLAVQIPMPLPLSHILLLVSCLTLPTALVGAVAVAAIPETIARHAGVYQDPTVAQMGAAKQARTTVAVAATLLQRGAPSSGCR